MKAGTSSRLLRGVWWVAAGYAALVLLAAANALYQGNVVRVNSEFSGVPLILLGLPWSMLIRDPKILESTFNNSVVVCTAYAAFNVVALLGLGYIVGQGARR